jgi:hypothetical protein
MIRLFAILGARGGPSGLSGRSAAWLRLRAIARI